MYETKAERDALFKATGKYAEVRLLNDAPTGFGWAILVNDYFNNPCVAKLPNTLAATDELRNEAKILAKIRELEHPNLVQLRDVEMCQLDWHGTVDERLYLILSYGGVNLRTRLGKLGLRNSKDGGEFTYNGGKPLPLDEWFRIARQVADGLKALHEFEIEPGEHIVHRDIKPENILIDKEGRIRITDFGISRVVERLSQSMTAGGTPPYLAPEHRLTAASDVYSFGVILYEMATGQYPFKGLHDKHYEMPKAPHLVNPEVPEPISQLILKTLDFNPQAQRGQESKQRFQNGRELLAELQRCQQRLYPVPAEYESLPATPSGDRHLYRHRAEQQLVRAMLYDIPRKELAFYRLAAQRELRLPGFISPQKLFEAEQLIGVIVPVVPWDSPHLLQDPLATETRAALPRPTSQAQRRVRPQLPAPAQAQAAEHALQQVASLSEQLVPLQELGLAHGSLSPFTAVWQNRDWLIDDLWTQALVGSCDLYRVYTPDDPVLACLAPEMAAWKTPPTLQTDVYGMGTIAYALLTGQLPGLPATIGPAGADNGNKPEDGLWWPTEIPQKWRDVILRALAAEPARRYANPQEFAVALRTCRWEQDWFASFLDNVRRMHAQGQSYEAYEALEKAQKKDPGNPWVHHLRGELFLKDGSPEYAYDENKIAYDIDPQPEVCLLHGQCCLEMNRFREAERYLREGLDQRDNPAGRLLLARCLDHLGRRTEAEAERNRAAQANFTN